MEELDLDDLLGNPEWRDKEITVKSYDNGKWVDGSTRIFNDTYTGFSRENMIERKMRNHAIRKYPKNLDNVYIREAYESTYEEERYNKPMNDHLLEDTQGALETEKQEKANTIVVEALEQEKNEPVVVQEIKPIKNDVKVENQPKVVEPITADAEPVSITTEIDEDLDDYFEHE